MDNYFGRFETPMTDEEKKKEKEYLKQEYAKARKEEWEKIKGLGTGARIQYLWDYYKIVLVIAAFVILTVYIIVNMIIGARTETLLYTCIMNVDEMDSNDEQLVEDFTQSIGGITKRQKIEFDSTMRIEPASDGTTQLAVASTVKMTAFLQSALLDVCLGPKEVAEFMQQQGTLLPLDDELDRDLKAEYEAGGYLYYAPEPLYDEETGAVILPETEADGSVSESAASDREQHIYAVRVDQSGVLERYGIHVGKEVWFCIVRNSQHKEMAMKLFEFLQN